MRLCRYFLKLRFWSSLICNWMMVKMCPTEVFTPDEIVQVMNCRRFQVSGFSKLGFTILSNHLQLIPRSLSNVMAARDHAEVARRWLLICPIRKNSAGDSEEENELELNSIWNDRRKRETTHWRLSDFVGRRTRWWGFRRAGNRQHPTISRRTMDFRRDHHNDRLAMKAAEISRRNLAMRPSDSS